MIKEKETNKSILCNVKTVLIEGTLKRKFNFRITSGIYSALQKYVI